MKIKIFTTYEDGKITLSKTELEDLLNEAYLEGKHSSNNGITVTAYPKRGNCNTWTSAEAQLNSPYSISCDMSRAVSLSSDLNSQITTNVKNEVKL